MEWQQYYPTYKFRKRDVLLKEYESAMANVESRERVFLNLANLILIVATILTPFIVAIINKPAMLGFGQALPFRAVMSLIVIIAIFPLLAIHYFAERQKSIVFDSRKVVVLRKMLGLDLAHNNLYFRSGGLNFNNGELYGWRWVRYGGKAWVYFSDRRRAYGYRDNEYMKLKIIQAGTPWMGQFRPWGWSHVCNFSS